MTFRSDLEDTWNWVKKYARSPSNQNNTPPSGPALPSSTSPAQLQLPASTQKKSESKAPATPPIGWRSWVAKPSPEEYVLWSPSQGTRWDGPTMRDAEPPEAMDRFGHALCGHAFNGFHSSKERSTAYGYLYHPDGAATWEATAFEPRNLTFEYGVLGQVESHGTIVEHEAGWRAQAVTVRKLIVFTQDARLRRDLEARYQCEVEVGEMPQCPSPMITQAQAKAWLAAAAILGQQHQPLTPGKLMLLPPSPSSQTTQYINPSFYGQSILSSLGGL